MRNTVRTLLTLLVAVLLVGCGGGEDSASPGATVTSPPATAAPSTAPDTPAPTAVPPEGTPAPAPPAATPADPAAPAPAAPPPDGGAPATVAGVTVAAPEGYAVVALPPEVADSFRQLGGQATSDGTIAEIDAIGFADDAGQPAAVLVATRYTDVDVTSPGFDQLRREQAATQGATLADEVVAGRQVLTSSAPVFVSWIQGTDTLVVVSGNGSLDLEAVKNLAAPTIAANP